jgi:SAM-dependent methyltransferase
MVSGVMSFYREHVLPWLIDLSMRQSQLTPYRSRVVSAASGRVLEIGIGSGLNLPFYGNSVSQIIGIEPSAKLLRMARAASREISMPLDLIEGTAETIPIDDRSIDTVVTVKNQSCRGSPAVAAPGPAPLVDINRLSDAGFGADGKRFT